MNAPRTKNNHASIVDAMHRKPARKHRWDFRPDAHVRREAARLEAEAFLRTWRDALASQASASCQ